MIRKLVTAAASAALAAIALSSTTTAQEQTPIRSKTVIEVPDVVVTAEKRAENLQDVPIAVSAFSTSTLQEHAAGDVASISNLTPNVTLDSGSPFSGSSSVLTAFIRGIGSSDFAFNIDPGVGVYVDGVYLARTVGANQDLLDVERVEILKGPQGTLFGRNTIGGAISIITRDPGNEFHANVDFTTGSFRRLQARGYVDMPLDATLRSSLSFGINSQEGYQRRTPFPGAGNFVADPPSQYAQQGLGFSARQGGAHDWHARGKLVWDPGLRLKVTLSGDYQDVDQSAMANSLLVTTENLPGAFAVTADRGTNFGNGPTALYNPASGLPPNGFNFAGLYNFCISSTAAQIAARNAQFLCGTRGTAMNARTLLPALGGVNVDADPNNNRLLFNSQFVTDDPDTTYATGNNYSRLTDYGISGTLTYELTEAMTLKSISAYRELRWSTGTDADGSPIANLELSFGMKQRQVSQELQLLGKTLNDDLKYVLGAYYFNESGSLHDFVTFSDGLLEINGPNSLATKNYALFGQADWRFNDRLSATLGGRYTHEKKELEGLQSDLDGFNYKLIGFPAASLPIPDALRAAAGFPDPANPLRYFPPGLQAQTFSNFSPKAGLQLRAAERMMAYASWSKGYRTGGWTTRLSYPLLQAPTFAEEKATTYEVGLKSKVLDQRLQINLAGFTTQYLGIQLNQQQGVSPTVVNAGNARINGGELELMAVVRGGLSVNASAGYADAYFTSVRPDAMLTPNLYQAGTFAGAQLPNTPHFKSDLSPRYALNLSDQGILTLLVDWTHVSSMWLDTGRTYALRRPETDILGASAMFEDTKEHWTLALGGTNLLDRRYITTGNVNLTGGAIFGTYNPPREWYARIGFTL